MQNKHSHCTAPVRKVFSAARRPMLVLRPSKEAGLGRLAGSRSSREK